MLVRVFGFFAAFFAVLAVAGVWLGAVHEVLDALGLPVATFTPLTALAALAAAAGAGLLAARSLKNAPPQTGRGEAAALLLVLAAAGGAWLFLSLPDLVYPLTCTDFGTHANAVRKVGQRGSLFLDDITRADPYVPLSHGYPQLFKAALGLVYTLTGHAYALATLASVLFMLLSVAGVFLAARARFEGYVPLLAASLYAFSLHLFWLLDSGFLPQIMAQFFLVAAVVFHRLGRRPLLALSLAGTLAWPHYFVVFLLYYAVYEALARGPRALLKRPAAFLRGAWPAAAALLALAPEVLGYAFEFVNSQAFATTVGLIEGGVSVPNPLAWAALAPAALGLYVLGVQHKKTEPWPVALLTALALLAAALVAAVAANAFLQVRGPFSLQAAFYQLYIPAKLALASAVPLSVLAAVGVAEAHRRLRARWVPAAAAALVLFQAAYFAGYVPQAAERDAFPPGFYDLAEDLTRLPPGTTLALDACFMHGLEVWRVPRFPYQPLDAWLGLDRGRPAQNRCRLVESGRLFEFPWAFADNEPGKPGQTVRDKATGKQVVFLDSNAADYVVSSCQPPGASIVARAGTVAVYRGQGGGGQ